MSDIELQQDAVHQYRESTGGEEVLLLLHGLFGATGNFNSIYEHFKLKYNVVIPVLPIMSLPLRKLGLKGLVEYVHDFVVYKGYDKVNIVGNSLGGHLAQLFALAYPSKVRTMTLTGSSGLFENSFGTGFPKRGDYEYVKDKARSIFYDPEIATKEIVDEVFETVNNRDKAIRVVVTAKSAVRNNLEDKIPAISCPTLLVWGVNDTITPAWVGEKFHTLIPKSKLEFIDKCGHAPMMEKSEDFNRLLDNFLSEELKAG